MFNSGFSQYLNSGLFSDITIVINKKQYNLHKLILVFSSDYFKNYLQSLENPTLSTDTNTNNNTNNNNSNNEILKTTNVIIQPQSLNSKPTTSTSLPQTSLLSSTLSQEIIENTIESDDDESTSDDSDVIEAFRLDKINNSNNNNTDINETKTSPITTILTSSTTTTMSSGDSNLSSTTTTTIQTTTMSSSSSSLTNNLPLGIGTSRKSFLSNIPPPPSHPTTLNKSTSPPSSTTKPLPIINNSSNGIIAKGSPSSSSSWIKSSPNSNTITTPIKRSSSSITQSFSSLLNKSSTTSSKSTLIPNSNNNSPNTSSNNLIKPTILQSKLNQQRSHREQYQQQKEDSHRLSLSSPLSLSSSSMYTSISAPLKPIQRYDPKNNVILEFEIEIINSKIEENRRVLESILEYCYTGQLELTEDTCIATFFYSNYFQMIRLKKLTIEYINEHINRKNALLWIEKSIELQIGEIIPKCIFVIARNFSQICESESSGSVIYSTFSFLPHELFLQILGHPSLSVFSEFTIYQAICKYIEAKKLSSPLTTEEIEELYQNVKFPYLTYHEYLMVTQNPLVPQKLLTEGLLVRLGNFEHPTSDFILRKLQVPRLMKRKSPARIFEYTSDYDNKGVIYYIATNGYTTEWSNPALLLQSNSDNPTVAQQLQPKIRVTASSIEKGSAADILEIQTRECWTKDIPSSWYSLDLGQKHSLILKYYTLRHGQNSKNDALINWVIQGSDDGIDWYTISRHQNENYFNSNFISHSFPVTSSSAYRFFRILQTGHNTSNHNFLAISGLELYGELYEY